MFGTGLDLEKQETCDHVSRSVVRSGDIERHICEECAHVSFVFMGRSITTADRSSFSRRIDLPH